MDEDYKMEQIEFEEVDVNDILYVVDKTLKKHPVRVSTLEEGNIYYHVLDTWNIEKNQYSLFYQSSKEYKLIKKYNKPVYRIFSEFVFNRGDIITIKPYWCFDVNLQVHRIPFIPTPPPNGGN
jgi:signal peptidase I